jgi:hypothetical protein
MPSDEKKPLSRKQKSEIWKSFWLHSIGAAVCIPFVVVAYNSGYIAELHVVLKSIILGIPNFLVWARFVTKIRKYQESTGIPYPSTYYALAIGSFVIIVGPLLLFFSLLIRMSKVPTFADPKPSALPFIDDESFYEEVAKELESDSMKPGLWTKALVEADGEQERVKPIYIRLRVAQLLTAKEAELRELQRLEDERIRVEEEARLQAAKLEAAELEAAELEAAELERKEKEAEAALEKRRQLEAAELERKEKEAEAALEKRRQLEAAQRLKKDLESLACYSTRICKGETYFYLFKQCTFYVSSDEILFIPKVCTDLPTEILVSRKRGDYIKMTLGIYEPGVTGIIHLKDGTQFRLNLDRESKYALSEWAKR